MKTTPNIKNQEIKKIEPNQGSDSMREDWVECTLGEVFKIISGSTPKGLKEVIADGEIPFYKVSDMNHKGNEVFMRKSNIYLSESDFENLKLKLYPKGTVIFPKRGGAILTNKKRVLFQNSCFDLNLMGVLPNEFIEDKYLFFWFQKLDLCSIYDGSNVPQINNKNIFPLSFPLSPLVEQKAIVKKIEELFSSLDSGIADLKKAQDQLVIYRQAVLKKAFEGEYPQKIIIEIADVNTGATPKRGNSEYWENGSIPWVTSTVVNNDFVNEPSELITENAIKKTNCKLIPKGSLLVAMYGEGKTRGKCSELNIDAATNQALAAITLLEENKDSKKFLKLFLLKNYEEIRLLSSGGVQPNLNLTIIKNTIIPFPSLKKQNQIVSDIESRLSVCDKVEKDIADSLEKAQALRQSILKKAFEGKLLSAAEIKECKEHKEYEPASVLLERIREEKKKK